MTVMIVSVGLGPWFEWRSCKGKVIQQVCPGAEHSWKSELWVRRPLVSSPVGIPSNQFLALVGILLKEDSSTQSPPRLRKLSNGKNIKIS